MFYVYKLIDPRDNLPFYVGKGKARRSRVHFNPSSKGQNPYKDAVIDNIRADGLDVVVEHIKCADEGEALALEQALIFELGRRDLNTGILTNLQNGGEGAGSGRVLSITTRTKQAQAHMGRPKSEASKALIAKSHARGGRSSSVVQITLDGTEIARFMSSRAAAKSTGIDGSQILYCCAGKYATAGGFRWQYTSPHEVVKRSKFIKQRVGKYSIATRELVEAYESVSAAARAMNTSTSYIARAAASGDFALGFMWQRLN